VNVPAWRRGLSSQPDLLRALVPHNLVRLPLQHNKPGTEVALLYLAVTIEAGAFLNHVLLDDLPDRPGKLRARQHAAHEHRRQA
jgi:hypothetical protein